MDQIAIVNPPNQLPAIGAVVLVVFVFLYFYSDAPKRGVIAMAGTLILAWMFFLNWVF